MTGRRRGLAVLVVVALVVGWVVRLAGPGWAALALAMFACGLGALAILHSVDEARSTLEAFWVHGEDVGALERRVARVERILGRMFTSYHQQAITRVDEELGA